MNRNAHDDAQHFAQLQARVLKEHGVQGTPRWIFEDSEQPIAAIEAGQGAPLVFFHGGGGMAATWAPLLAELQGDYRCIAVDRPGHGLSYRVDYRRIADYRSSAVEFVGRTLDGLGLERAALVGNSMGGFFSLAFALEHPERVERLVLPGAPAGLDRDVPLMLKLLATPGIGPLLWATVARPTEASLRKLYEKLLVADASRVHDADVLCLLASHRRQGTDIAWLSLLRRFLNRHGVRERCYLRDELLKLKVPTLFLWGDRDAFAPPSSGQLACKSMQAAEFVCVAGAGHQPWSDQPRVCADAIRRYLARDAGVAQLRRVG